VTKKSKKEERQQISKSKKDSTEGIHNKKKGCTKKRKEN
jgi:hypothetical protein